MNRILLYILTICIVTGGTASAQTNSNCAISQLKGFMIDGQQHTLTLQGSDKGRAYFSLFDGFQYRIVVCSSTNKNYKIALYDIEKKVLFSTHCENYVKAIDVAFMSNIAGYIEITAGECQNKLPEFNIVIGFKEAKTIATKNKKNK